MRKIFLILLILSANFSGAQTVTSDSADGKNVLTTTLKSRTFMRKQPTESSSIVDAIPKGTEVNIVELIDDRYYRKVKYNNQIGFVEKSRCQEDISLVMEETKFAEESLKNKIKEKGQSQLFVMPDSLKILYLESRINNIELHLAKADKKYQSGTALIAIGSLVSIGTSIFAMMNGKSILDKEKKGAAQKKINNMKVQLNAMTFSGYGLSSLMLLIGFSIQIDSHRHIGYAGGLK